MPLTPEETGDADTDTVVPDVQALEARVMSSRFTQTHTVGDIAETFGGQSSLVSRLYAEYTAAKGAKTCGPPSAATRQ
jgi:hypothetical protein